MEHLFLEGNSLKTFDDVYREVGKIIRACNEWEQEFRELLSLAGVNSKTTTASGLHKMNKLLHENKVLNDYEAEMLGKVIDRRNYIVHMFFLEFRNYSLEENSEILMATYYVINEARDVVANKIDELNGIQFGRRPTIFDKKS